MGDGGEEGVLAAAMKTEMLQAIADGWMVVPTKLLECYACGHPLKPPIDKCDKEHLVCEANACREFHYKGCERTVAHCELADTFASHCKVPCGFERFGCATGGVLYYKAAEHRRACPHAPFGCPERGCGFFAPLNEVLDHVSRSDGHSRQTIGIRYGQPSTVTLALSAPWYVFFGQEDATGADRRRNVFLLSLEGEDATTEVSVVCIRADGGAAGAPQFSCKLTVERSGHCDNLNFESPLVSSSSLPGGAPSPGKVWGLPVAKRYLSGDNVTLIICINRLVPFSPPPPPPTTTLVASTLPLPPRTTRARASTIVPPAPAAPVKSTKRARKDPSPAKLSLVAAAMKKELQQDMVDITAALSVELLNCFVCRRPLRPPIFKCDIEHLVCASCRGVHGESCTSSVARCKLADTFASHCKVPCGFERFGCATGGVVYYEAAEHRRACPHAPFGCPERGCGFFAPLNELLDHVSRSYRDGHTSPTIGICYGQPTTVTLALSALWYVFVGQEDSTGATGADPRRNVFLLSLEGEDGTTEVSLVCVRADDGAPGAPQFSCKLTVQRSDNGDNLNFESSPVSSSSLPGGAPSPGKVWGLPVAKRYLSGGDSVTLIICINKLEPPSPPAPPTTRATATVPSPAPTAATASPCPADADTPAETQRNNKKRKGTNPRS